MKDHIQQWVEKISDMAAQAVTDYDTDDEMVLYDMTKGLIASEVPPEYRQEVEDCLL